MIVSVMLGQEGRWETRPLTSFTVRDDDSGGLCLLQMMLASLTESDVTDIRIECWMMSMSAVMLGADGRIEEMWALTSFHSAVKKTVSGGSLPLTDDTWSDGRVGRGYDRLSFLESKQQSLGREISLVCVRIPVYYTTIGSM